MMKTGQLALTFLSLAFAFSANQAGAQVCSDLFREKIVITQPINDASGAARFRHMTASAAEIRLAEMILENSAQVPAEAELAFLGDKGFVFGPAQDSFMMVVRSGRSLVAMAGPFGNPESAQSTIDAFTAEARANGLRPVAYAVSPEMLPAYQSAGYKAEKIGETAIVRLAQFTLEGSSRQQLRSYRRKVEAAGASVEVRVPDAALLRELKPISDAWIRDKNATEKKFSMGYFDEAYLSRNPVAVVRVQGKVVAFMSLLASADKSNVSLDLMRSDSRLTPPHTMDYLFSETFLWAKAEGYQNFDLTMAPLSGLEENGTSTMFSQAAQFIYNNGEQFYNFKGVRSFKKKFDPEWESRYLVVPRESSMILGAVDAVMATNAPGSHTVKARSTP